MRVVLQRVTRGQVRVADEVVGAIGHGFVALVGITHDDTPEDARRLARKTAQLRVFADEAGRMNRSALDVGGGVLVVSQFTLYADVRRGRRPAFVDAARPEYAAELVDIYADVLRAEGIGEVATGRFGAMMQVEIINDGPVTILLDTLDLPQTQEG